MRHTIQIIIPWVGALEVPMVGVPALARAVAQATGHIAKRAVDYTPNGTTSICYLEISPPYDATHEDTVAWFESIKDAGTLATTQILRALADMYAALNHYTPELVNIDLHAEYEDQRNGYWYEC